MLIERTAFYTDNVLSLATLRARCLGCKDCCGPCHTLMQMRELPEIVLASGRARP